MAYLLDANVFIAARNNHYGFDFCPAFWEWLDTANGSGAVHSVERVYDELIERGDDLSDWAHARHDFFLAITTDDVRRSTAGRTTLLTTTRPQKPSSRTPPIRSSWRRRTGVGTPS